MAYIQGFVQFDGLKMKIDRRSYVPNLETENLVNYGATLLRQRKVDRPIVIDVGTGCGNIAIAFAKRFPGSSVIATDILQDTLTLARCNATTHGCTNVEFVHTDLIDDVECPRSPDLVVADLPYGSPEYLLKSNALEEMQHMPIISRFTEGLLDAYLELIEQIKAKRWRATLIAESGTVPEKVVSRLLPPDVEWTYHAYQDYSLIQLEVGDEKDPDE